MRSAAPMLFIEAGDGVPIKSNPPTISPIHRPPHSNGTARRTSLGSPTASSGSTQPPNKSAIPTASSIGLVPILPGDTPTQPPLRLTVVRPFLLHAAVATGALVVVHCPWIGRFNKPSAYKVAHCLPSSNVGQSLRLVVPRHTRLALLPPAPPVSEGGRGAAEAATDRAAADGALPFQRPSSFLAAAVTALADGLLELLDAMGDDDGYSPQGWDPQEACGIRALALLVPRAVLLSGSSSTDRIYIDR